jgi:hypothetical protein
MAKKPTTRIDLKTGKMTDIDKLDSDQTVQMLMPYEDLTDPFEDLKANALDERAETERLSKYWVDDTDIEGKSFVDRGEKMIFTYVSIMAEYAPFKAFRLDRFPRKWLHYAMGENGRGRQSVMDILRGKIDIGPQKDLNELPGMGNRK